jgi:uncharacterized MnhB-related membrane protein
MYLLQVLLHLILMLVVLCTIRLIYHPNLVASSITTGTLALASGLTLNFLNMLQGDFTIANLITTNQTTSNLVVAYS